MAGLVALWGLGGCRQIFGIGDPGLATGDAPQIGIDTKPPPDGPRIDAPPASQLCDPLDSSLVGCWDFDGTTSDGTPHHLDITSSGVPLYVAGHVGQAIDATMIDLNVAETAVLDVNAVTIEAWIYADQLPGGGAGTRASILDNNNQYALYLEANGSIRCYAGPSTANMSNVIVAHTWTHVACTAAGASILAYVNGVQVASGVLAGIPTSGTTGLTLGSDNPSGNGSRFSGKLDAVRLYSRALSSKEICFAYNPLCNGN